MHMYAYLIQQRVEKLKFNVMSSFVLVHKLMMNETSGKLMSVIFVQLFIKIYICQLVSILIVVLLKKNFKCNVFLPKNPLSIV